MKIFVRKFGLSNKPGNNYSLLVFFTKSFICVYLFTLITVSAAR